MRCRVSLYRNVSSTGAARDMAAALQRLETQRGRHPLSRGAKSYRRHVNDSNMNWSQRRNGERDEIGSGPSIATGIVLEFTQESTWKSCRHEIPRPTGSAPTTLLTSVRPPTPPSLTVLTIVTSNCERSDAIMSRSSEPSGPSEPSELFQKGIKIRREVLGDAYVDKALAAVSRCPPPCALQDAGRQTVLTPSQPERSRDLIRLASPARSTSRKSAGRRGVDLA